MRNTWGKMITITLFGESHGPAIGCVIDGLPAGLPYPQERIERQLDKRRPKGAISTARKEADIPHVLSGVYQERFTGSPVTIMMENSQQHSGDYSAWQDIARPSHADYTAFVKYDGANDPRGGGHFSGRITAPLVAAGAIAIDMLERKGIRIASHIQSLQSIEDEPFSEDEDILRQQMEQADQMDVAVLDETIRERMEALIVDARNQGDSVGGILESAVTGVPAGVGEPWFDSLEGVLAHGIFSIGGVKGVSFGAGFSISRMNGSQANDSFFVQDDVIRTRTNHSGGIQGGISNGMPMIIHTAIKPTASIFQPQQSVNMVTKEEATLSLQGRHDPAIIHRARVVIDSIIALTLLDQLTLRYGPGWWKEGAPCATV